MASNNKKQPVQKDAAGESELVRRIKANPLLFTGTIVILAIVIVAFVLVPALPGGGGGGVDLTFGSYDKIPIAFVPGNYFSQAYQTLVQEGRADDISAQLRIWRSAFEQTVVHTGILEEMKGARYAPPEKTVDLEVARLPMFQENGRFSEARYRRLDSSARLSLWRQMREDLAEQLYRSDIGGLMTPAAEAAFVASMLSPQRSFDMTAFPVNDYPDSEAAAYAAANPALFRIAHLSRITVNSSERDARRILDQIRDGTVTFEDAAKNNSRDSYAEQGGDMGIKMAYELAVEAPGMEAALAALARGEISEVTALVSAAGVPSGWAFFRAEEAPFEADMEDPANLEKVRNYMLRNERGRMEDWAIARADAFIASFEGDFAGALAEQGLPLRHFGPLPINYGEYGELELFTPLSSFGVAELAGGAYNENFWQTAFSTPLNTLSRPVVLGGNVLVLFPLEESSGDDQTRGYIESAYSTYWMSVVAKRSVENFFLNNGKLEDRFLDSYINYFSPRN
ncbi:MAG: SurA N-terminal domain-containing protein [Treponema sp.]|jgi:hypothetical protein|nr:SurA N-terminal domain-containing protein [Treponema sp.]